MKLKWIKQSDKSINDITDFMQSATWSGSTGQVSRCLTVNILYSPLDKNLLDINIKPGDRLRLYDDKSRLLIDSMVYTRERKSEQGTVAYTSYDDLNRLLKSTMSYSFKNTTAEKVTAKVCSDLKIATGTIKKTGINIKKMLLDSQGGYDIIMTAYTKAYRENGKKYIMLMTGVKLNVLEKGEIVEGFTLSDGVNITGSSYTETIDNMINRVKIYNDKGVQVGEVSNKGDISIYGIFQGAYTKETGVNSTTAAKAMLHGIDTTANIEAIGNVECISGYGVKIKDSLTGLTGLFWIESDSHTFENGAHTMSLDIAFKNIMDTKEGV